MITRLICSSACGIIGLFNFYMYINDPLKDFDTFFNNPYWYLASCIFCLLISAYIFCSKDD